MSVERVIGVDFGTSTSVIKVKTYKDGKPVGEIVGVDYIRFNNRDFVPTLVYTARDGSLLFGYEAANASVPGRLSFNFKLDLINEDDEVRENAVQNVQLFYQYLYKIYSEQSSRLPKCDFESTIISYPAKWSQSLRDNMISLAQSAGFKNVTGLDEPTAAVKSVMVHNNGSIRLNDNGVSNILVIDMGAGTTDLVLCRYIPEEGVKILNVWPKGDKGALLGGREVDEALCEYVKQYLVNCGLPSSRDFRNKYIDKCKAWKETNVSSVLAKPDGVVRYCGFAESIVAMLGTDAEFPAISRREFESMLEMYLSQLPQMINDCLDDSGFSCLALDCVILTGGHSQWYFVEEIITGKITKYGRLNLEKIINDKSRVIRTPNPQETVALGLAYQKLSNEVTQQTNEYIEENVVFCTKCGIKNEESERYCNNCGASLSKNQQPFSHPVYTTPQTTVNDGKVEIFSLSLGKTVSGITNTVQSFFNSKNMNTQIIDTKDGGFIVQSRDKDGAWKQFIGMDVALSVVIKQVDSNNASIAFTQAKWVDKGSVMALSMLILWPLAITSGIGMYIQSKLPGEIKNAVAVYVNS